MDLREMNKAKEAVNKYVGKEGLYEIDLETTSHQGITWRGNKRISSRLDDSRGCYVRAGEGHLGSVVQEGGESNYDQLINEAAEIGKILDEAEGGEVKNAWAKGGFYQELERELYTFSKMDEIASSLAERFYQELLLPLGEESSIKDKITVYVGERTHEEAVVNNHGLEAVDESSVLEIHVHVYGRDYFTTAPDKDHISLEEFEDHIWIDKQIYEKEQEEASYVPYKGSEGEAVLGSGVMVNWLITGWMHFTANRYLAGSTCFTENEGALVGSSLVTIKDLPSVMGGGYIRNVDAEGSVSRESTLVDQGRLRGLMSTCKEKERVSMGIPGSAGRTASLVKSNSIKVVPRNTVWMKGESSLKEMLSSSEETLYIYEAFDQFHALDIATGDFHFPCKGATLKNGQVVNLIDRITLEGNSKDLLKNVVMNGKGLLQQPLVIMETYMVAAPPVRVSKIKVSGNTQ